jgi:hypothetical protein
VKRLASLLAFTILVVPPKPVTAKSIVVGVCGEGDARISIPVKAPLPGEGGDHGCCKKGCHAANDRKKRLDGTTDDGCC